MSLFHLLKKFSNKSDNYNDNYKKSNREKKLKNNANNKSEKIYRNIGKITNFKTP